MPEPNCKSCKHYFDGYKGAVRPRCKLVMDRIKQHIEDWSATTDELRYYCGFGDFNPDWTCDKYEKNQESTAVSWAWDESKKALIDICEALTGYKDPEVVELGPEELFKKIFLRLYYMANYTSIWTNDPTEDYDEYEKNTLEWLREHNRNITREDLQKTRKEAEHTAISLSREFMVVNHKTEKRTCIDCKHCYIEDEFERCMITGNRIHFTDDARLCVRFISWEDGEEK